MKLPIYTSIVALVCASFHVSAATSGAATTGSTAGGGSSTAVKVTQPSVPMAPNPNSGRNAFTPVAPNSPNSQVAIQNGAAVATTGGSSNAFLPAGITNAAFTNNFAFTNFGTNFGTNFFGLNGSNGFGTNFMAGLSNAFSTNFFGTNLAGQDRGFTEFDTTLIFRIRHVAFGSRELAALGQLVSFLSQGGNVTVNGVVPTAEMQQTVVSNVRAVPGVVGVNNQLVIDPRAAAVFANRQLPAQGTNLAPTSDPSLGESRIYQNTSNRFGIRQTAPSSTLPAAVSNRPSTFITTP